MCFYADSAEVHLDGHMVRLVFCVDGDPVCQVAMKTSGVDDAIADYLRLVGERDGRQASILAFQQRA